MDGARNRSVDVSWDLDCFRLSNFCINCDKYPANNCVVFYDSEVISKVVHALRSLTFQSYHIANSQNGSIVISQVLALVIASVGSIAISAVLVTFIAKPFWNRF